MFERVADQAGQNRGGGAAEAEWHDDCGGHDDGALPSATLGRETSHRAPTSLSGSKRWEQLGCDACGKILDATLNGLVEAKAVLVIDAHPVAGELLEAFIIKQLSFNVPMFYFGLVQSSSDGGQFKQNFKMSFKARSL